jgi:hypothetical protein
MMRLPDWAKARIGGAATWQWLGFTFGLLVGALFIFGVYRLARRLAAGNENDLVPLHRGFDELIGAGE